MPPKNDINENSPDFKFGVIITRLDALDEKIDALDKKYMWAAGIVAFFVSMVVTIVAIFIGK